MLHFYRPQTKFAKVMFLHLSVSHSVHRGGRAWQGGMHGRGACVAGGVHGVGACVAEGACMVGACMAEGACMAGGMHAMDTPPTPRDMVSQCAGDMHPTGMHSC